MGQEVSKTLSEVERIAEIVGKVERTMPSGLRQVSETPGVNSRMAPSTRSGIGALPEGIPPQGHLKPEEVLTPGSAEDDPMGDALDPQIEHEAQRRARQRKASKTSLMMPSSRGMEITWKPVQIREPSRETGHPNSQPPLPRHPWSTHQWSTHQCLPGGRG